MLGDIESIGRRAAERWVRDRFAVGADFSVMVSAPHTSVAVIDGIPVAIGGFIDRGHGNAIAWSLLVDDIEPIHFVGLVRAFRRHITRTPFSYIEAHCIEEMPQLHRWVRALGFHPAGGERCFTPAGKEFRIFVFRNYHDGN